MEKSIADAGRPVEADLDPFGMPIGSGQADGPPLVRGLEMREVEELERNPWGEE